MEDDTLNNKTGEHPAPSSLGGVMDVKPVGAPPLHTPQQPPTPASLPTQKPTPEPEHIVTLPEGEQHSLPPSHPATPEHEEHLLPAHAGHKNRPPIVAIVIAVIVGLALIGIAGFAYMNMRNQDQTHDQDHMQETTQQQSGATVSDVDSTAKDVDNAISAVDDNKDMPESDLTDQGLGL